ncbi:hypothetical protein COLO4_15810 [Corchorus olitorius]|uniref:Uncharacterized protein n=1 Tax=Corchorus olitorius TaxID=93759 RepID=A0A1R3JL98_9ROSI|nr:hypothetical protein COLO4_15810 [Corchorus olitorius]
MSENQIYPHGDRFGISPLEIVPDAEAANGYVARTGDVISVNVGSRIARPYVMSNDGRILFWAETGMGVLHVVRTDLNTSEENRHFSVMLEDYTRCLYFGMSEFVSLVPVDASWVYLVCFALRFKIFQVVWPNGQDCETSASICSSGSIMEASSSSLSTFFFRASCLLLRTAFGLHKYLLQPRGVQLVEVNTAKSIEQVSLKTKKVVGK